VWNADFLRARSHPNALEQATKDQKNGIKMYNESLKFRTSRFTNFESTAPKSEGKFYRFSVNHQTVKKFEGCR
jgi:hypothetical protein